MQPAGLRAREEPWPPAAAAWRGSGPSPPSWLLKSRIHIPEELRRHGEPPVSPPQILFPDASRFHTDLPSPSSGFTGSAPGVVLYGAFRLWADLAAFGGGICPQPPPWKVWQLMPLERDPGEAAPPLSPPFLLLEQGPRSGSTIQTQVVFSPSTPGTALPIFRLL